MSAAIRAAADPLHAIGAFLHHPALADRDFGVLRALLRVGRGEAVIFEEVEPPHLVGAVLRAVAGADAAVVDLGVQSVMGVDGGVDRADDLAGGVLALHAGHRLEQRRRVLRRALVVAVDAEPVHLVAAAAFLGTDDGRVVFGRTGRDAGHAAEAGGQIDAHPPGLARGFPNRDRARPRAAAAFPHAARADRRRRRRGWRGGPGRGPPSPGGAGW